MSETKIKQASADFVENKGQWDSRAKFMARGSGMALWVKQAGLRLDYFVRSGGARNGQVLDLGFVGANQQAPIKGIDETNFISQYIRRHQPVHTARSFKSVGINGLYAGIDLRLYKQDGKPRYDLIVAPGANPGQIQMQVSGSKKVGVDKKGNLNIATSLGDLKLQGLFAYQTVNGVRKQVPARFVMKGNKVRFALGAYDHRKQLVIDPIIYGSYYGGDGGMDEVRAVVSDADGGVFMTGNTFAPDFPLVLGPYISLNGTSDAFISKFQGDAYVHNFASYFGGSGDETGKFIGMDPSGNNVWVAGTTSSNDLPIVGSGQLQGALSGSTDTFLMEWTKDQTQVLVPTYSTYFGSTNAANGEELKGFGVGSLSGDLFIAGVTGGTGIPGPGNAFPGVGDHAFVVRLDSAGQTVLWHHYIEGAAAQVLGLDTYLGLPPPPLGAGLNPGTTNTEANLSAKMASNCLAVDKDENSLVTGTVTILGNENTATAINPSFKTTPGVFVNPNFGWDGRMLRNSDIFVEKLDASGNLVYGCLIGGADFDVSAAIAVDGIGNAYITGIAGSHDFPRTFGTFGQLFDQQQNCTVTKLNQDASNIIYSTNLRTHKSPSGALYPIGISVDVRGFAFITGLIIDGAIWPDSFPPPDPDPPTAATGSPGAIPTTADAIRATYTYPAPPNVPSWDSWLVVLDDTATTEVYGTYIGGNLDDIIYPPYNDRFGDVWVMGSTDLTRAYSIQISDQSAPPTGQTANGNINPFITDLAFKPHGESGNPFTMQNVTTPYGVLAENGTGGGRAGLWISPVPPPFGSNGPIDQYIPTARARDGYIMRFRLRVPIIQNLVLNPATIPGGLGASSVGTITLDTAAPVGGVDVDVTLSNAIAASLDPNTEVTSIVVNIPAGQTTGTFTVYSNIVSDPAQVDVKASYLGNFKQARLTVVPWLSSLTLSPSSLVGGNSGIGRVTLAAPAPTGGLEITLISSDASTVLFPGGNTFTVPAGQQTANFTISTMGVDIAADYTVSASALTVGKTQTLRVLTANLQTVSFVPGRVAGGTPSTGTVRLDGLPGPSGFDVNLSISAGTPGYTITPANPIHFNPTDGFKDFTVNTVAEPVNTSRVVTADRPVQGAYSHETISGTLFIDANFLTNLTLNPTQVNAGQTSTGTVTISNTAQAGGVTVTLSSDNPAVAQVPATGNVLIPAGTTNATFPVTTAATALDTVVNITATRGANSISRPLTVKGVAFTLSASPTSVIGGAGNITGTAHLALAAPVGGVTVTLLSSNPAAASVPANVVVPQGQLTADFTITTSPVAATQNVTITGETQPGTTATVVVQVRAISLAALVVSPSYVKGGTFIHVQAVLDAPAPAGGANVGVSSTNIGVINVGTLVVQAGQTMSPVYTIPVRRVNRTIAVTLTGNYNAHQIATTVTVHR